MKYILIGLLLIACVACTDHDRVMSAYKDGNPHATDLLLHGFNMKNSSYIDYRLIKQSLNGDEKAKNIVYAQIESLKGLPSDNHCLHTTVIPMNTAVRTR